MKVLRATTVGRASWLNNFNNNSNFNANDRNINNNNRLRGIAHSSAETTISSMSLWERLCSSSNLELAFRKAMKHKTTKADVIEFEQNIAENLALLRVELLLHAYSPKPLAMFILRDPKTRKISKSHFRDRVIHHALYNILEPIFEKEFIYDSYANRKGKGALKALERFDYFKRKATKNYHIPAFCLKADIRHYFDEVDHNTLIRIIQKKVPDAKIRWLIRRILGNYSIQSGKGMPLGNLTSQFFANVYLNQLDQFVKHQLKAKYYLRYVDDFVIIHSSQEILEQWKEEISQFLAATLMLQLHPEKSKIIPLHRGIEFLGFKVFFHHRLLKKRNLRSFQRKMDCLHQLYQQEQVSYDELYDILEGWCAHTKNAAMFTQRQKILDSFEEQYPYGVSTKEVNRSLSRNKK